VKGAHLSSERMNDNIERNVLAAYRSLHERGVIHGDIRRENVLVLEDESVRIIDFDNASMLPHDDLRLILCEEEEIMSILKELKNDCSGPARNGTSH
jgi:RIO-like serine/threonine protein kinase